jgi:DNA invertase Pin-like site-specific DNA recombinase
MHEVVGYARVSTDDQNLTLQQDALEKAGCTKFSLTRLAAQNPAGQV